MISKQISRLALAFAGMWFRDRLGLSPVTVSRALCAYIGISGALWMAYGLTLDCTLHQSNTAFIALAFGAGLGAATIVSISSPPVAIINALVAMGGALAVSDQPQVLSGITATTGPYLHRSVHPVLIT